MTRKKKYFTPSSDSLTIPTRLGLQWIATQYSLIVGHAVASSISSGLISSPSQVCDSDTEEIVMRYHEKCVHVGSSLSPSPIPKLGNDFLEIEEFPDAITAELLGRRQIYWYIILHVVHSRVFTVGFVFVNIMRRTRFGLPLYQFPLVDGSDGERHSVSGLLNNVKDSLSPFRRNTL